MIAKGISPRSKSQIKHLLLFLIITTVAILCGIFIFSGRGQSGKRSKPKQPIIQNPGGNGVDLYEERAVEIITGEKGVNRSMVEMLSKEDVLWSDSSLGCPQEGLFYSQVIIPGVRVVLKAGEITYRVHLSENDSVICENPVD